MSKNHSRRQFIQYLAATLGSLTFSRLNGETTMASTNQHKTIQQVIDLIINKITDQPLEKTVDTIKIGNASQPVTGITSTFLATCDVIQQSIQAGNNFIITHEPTFYNHLDEVDWLADNSVYQFKRRLIEENQLVIWRCHDYWHHLKPDGIMTGVEKKLGWQSFADPSVAFLYRRSPLPLSELITEVKQKLEIPLVRVIGNLDLPVEKIGFLVGSPGGKSQIKFLNLYDPDVLITGEINEWETNIFTQDAIATGRKKALVILGHAASEEAGMAYFVEWLQALIPTVKINHIPFTDRLQFV